MRFVIKRLLEWDLMVLQRNAQSFPPLAGVRFRVKKLAARRCSVPPSNANAFKTSYNKCHGVVENGLEELLMGNGGVEEGGGGRASVLNVFLDWTNIHPSIEGLLPCT